MHDGRKEKRILIEIHGLYINIILIGVWIIYRLLTLKKRKEKNLVRELFINIFFIYSLILINLTILKMSQLQISLEGNYYVNYIPFVETTNMFKDNFMGIGNAFYNVIGNILIFVPLGFFIPLLFYKKNNIGKIALYGFITSLTIEIIQLFTKFNLTDIDDIIFNTIGTILGYIIFNILYKLIKGTKLEELIKNITSSFDRNLVKLIIKPVSTMVMFVLVFSIFTLYNSTMTEALSDDDIAKVVFKNHSNTDFQIVREHLKHKLFLKDEGSYLELRYIKKVLKNRWDNSDMLAGEFKKINGDYYVELIHEKSSMSVVAFGRNKNASKIEIKFNGKMYNENLEKNQYFIVSFPSFEILADNSDIDNFFQGKVCKDLSIKFYDNNGNEDNHMKLARQQK